VYKLWNPSIFPQFSGPAFHDMIRTMMKCQKRWPQSPVSKLPDDCLFYIFNMCHWNWAGDNLDQIRRYKKSMLSRLSSISIQNGSHCKGSEQSNRYIDDNTLKSDGTSNRDITVKQMEEIEFHTSDEDEEYEEHEEDEEYEEDEAYESEEEERNSDDDDEEESDEDDDGYQDHRGSSSFFFQIFDDLADPIDDQVMADTARNFHENQRRLWFRTHFLQFAAAPRSQDGSDEDED